MTKFIIFTDLHMVPDGTTIIGIDPYRRLANGIDHVNRYHADADRVIFAGDLTHQADRASYERLKDLLFELIPPAAVMLGNHDRREVFLEVFREAARDENGFVQQVIDFPDCRAVLLDTLFAPPYDYPMSHAGQLCERRLNWLDRQLGSADDRPVLIFMHHPPHASGFAGIDMIRLINEEQFYGLVKRHGNVRHIFAGHVHRTISGSSRGIPFSIFKSPVHQQPMPFDIADASLSVDEPAAYGIAVVTADGVLVHTEDYEIAKRDAAVA
ncbi:MULTISPECIES: phosphodiesterase [Sinorhizobium]|uniref:Phosphodiesterase n=2 Tax=Sinorhizobium TaxID=28105 RepID=A0A2S3YLC0_9HYPH|nr:MULTISPECIES: phosphodiesterase [Sinorhizobium]ASY55061.1 3',5'-cyclic-nucleotide phosphodiesterase [Sinorhizobium sp. CCBAU 05631]AUX75059.1 3',5'-cyclic adenosine monophosphate phosphodiesterase CpdA [Sinorhizobium fredii]PDT41923.1 phosphodiesterase [Sinorhizobium sp. FG01]PDT53903.1 phosphodiesterase [Sinorhizobium sp. NG07B]POH28733.1 phosphodiesterase [Sinorhizobium americanum]